MRRLSSYGPSIVVLLTAMGVLFLGPRAVQELTYKQTQARMIQASNRLEENNILELINQSYRDIAAVVEPSVVHISARQVQEDPRARGLMRRGISTGSGWIYDANGHIGTNYHAVENAQQIEV